MKLSLKFTAVIFVLLLITGTVTAEIKLSGYLDSDIALDLKSATYTNNDELDLGANIGLAENVSADVFATVLHGSVPAGGGAPVLRWVSFAFDGVSLSLKNVAKNLDLTIGDVVHQWGTFNYYFYKRTSMISPESFTRGAMASYSKGVSTFTGIAGVSDMGNQVINYCLSYGAVLSDKFIVEAYGQLQNDDAVSHKRTTLGAEAKTSFGLISLKGDFGIRLPGGSGYADSTKPAYNVLLEPSFSSGSFSLAASFMMGKDESGINPDFGIKSFEELMIYAEPGFSFSDKFAAGLPLEYHDASLDVEKDEEIWVVPTLYFYPAPNTEIWLWGQAVMPLGDGAEKGFYAGSEIIVKF